MNAKTLGILVAAIILVAASATIFFLNIPPEIPPDGNGGGYPISNVIQFSEVMFSPSHQDDEWVELYCYRNLSGTLSGWELGIVGGKTLTIPDVEVIEYSYLAVHFGSSGDTPSSNTQYSKHVYLNETTEVLDNAGGALHFRHPNGSVVDSVVWGTAPSGVQLWNASISPVYTTDPTKSISIWGKDLNSAENWYESHPTPAKPNVEIFTITDPDVTIALVNGYHLSDMNFSEISFEGTPEVVVNPTSSQYKNEIKECAEASLKFYVQEGYGLPWLDEEDGKFYIYAGEGTDFKYTEGASHPNGRVFITPGTMESKVSLKYAVDHEVFHNIAFKPVDNLCHSTAGTKENWWGEGMAVWLGIKSTMKRFNMTLTQVMDEFKRVNCHNWYTHWTSMNFNIFFNTFGTFESVFDAYMGSYLFIKFLNETTGTETLKNIHNRIQRERNSEECGRVIVGAKQAIEDELGTPLEELLRQFYEWRVLEATRCNGAPVTQPDITLNYAVTEIQNMIAVQPTGAVIEQINILNETDTMKIDLVSNTNMMITAIIYYKNGTHSVAHHTMDSTQLHLTINTKNASRIQLIRQNLDDTVTAMTSFIIPRIEPEVTLTFKWIYDGGLLVGKNISVDITAWPGANGTVTLTGPSTPEIEKTFVLDSSGNTRVTFDVIHFGEYTALVHLDELVIEEKVWA